jgi:hypothetical protein
MSHDDAGGRSKVFAHASSSEPPASDRQPPASDKHGGRRALSRTLRVRPWADLPGVLGYLVTAEDGAVLDAWGSFDVRTAKDLAALGSIVRALDPIVEGSGIGKVHFVGSQHHVVSALRRDGCIVHLLLGRDADVARIVAAVGGRS